MTYRVLVFLSSALACAHAQTSYDLVLKGGHVIDPRNNIDAVRDVGIRDGRIAAVSADIPQSQGLRTVDVKGMYVTPGLIDIHVHVFAGNGPAYTGVSSVRPDDHSFRSGVTTMVDAGSSGWKNFPEFKATIIDKAKTRVLAFLNIVGAGMAGRPEQDPNEMDPEQAVRMAAKYPETIVGFKSAHYRGPEWVSVDRALKAGIEAKLPIMVDFGQFRKERPFSELVTSKLRPGDIYTHTFLAWVPLLDDSGKVQPYMFEARKRGVIFDAGHGGGSFVFRHAAPAIKQGFPPDSISTDLHITSMNGPMKDMSNVMSKFLNMGLPLADVIRRSTANPAREIRQNDLGHLSVGAPADVAVFSLQKGNFGFADVYGARLRGTQKLICELTVRDGRVVWDLNGITRDDWEKLGKYGSVGDPRWDRSIAYETAPPGSVEPPRR
jgi:dihydroorotase